MLNLPEAEEPSVSLGIKRNAPVLNGSTTYSQSGTEKWTHLLNHSIGHRKNACTTTKSDQFHRLMGIVGASYAHRTPNRARHPELCKCTH